MKRPKPASERPVIFSIEAEDAITSVICAIVLVTLTVGAGCGFAIARTIDAVWR